MTAWIEVISFLSPICGTDFAYRPPRVNLPSSLFLSPQFCCGFFFLVVSFFSPSFLRRTFSSEAFLSRAPPPLFFSILVSFLFIAEETRFEFWSPCAHLPSLLAFLEFRRCFPRSPLRLVFGQEAISLLVGPLPPSPLFTHAFACAVP